MYVVFMYHILLIRYYLYGTGIERTVTFVIFTYSLELVSATQVRILTTTSCDGKLSTTQSLNENLYYLL